MNHRRFGMDVVLALMALVVVMSGSSRAWAIANSAAAMPLTTQEQTQRLSGLSGASQRMLFPAKDAISRSAISATSSESPLQTIREAIMKAQPDTKRIRVPLNEDQLAELQINLAEQGVTISRDELQGAVDVASALLRENPDLAVFESKVMKGLNHRIPFHGNVAEFAEARMRKMVLTKDIHSQIWDLTEIKPRPRSLQLKIYSNDRKGLRSAIKDVEPVIGKMGRGARARVVVPQSTIDEGVKMGELEPHGEFYKPTTGARITVMPSKAFADGEESISYTKDGANVLSKLARSDAGMRALRPLSKALRGTLGVTGVLGSVALGWDAYHQSGKAWSMFHEPEVWNTPLPYLQTGVALGTWTETGSLGVGSGAEIAGWFGAGSGTISGVAGDVFVPAAVGVEVLKEGMAGWKYYEGTMNGLEFERTSIGHGTVLAFTAGGAGIGVWFFGVGALPGAAIGMGFGYITKFGENWWWGHEDRLFTAAQQKAVKLALDRRYGLAK